MFGGVQIILTKHRVSRDKTDFYSRIYMGVHRKCDSKKVVRIRISINRLRGVGEGHPWVSQ